MDGSVRQRNLARILRIVHLDGPQSRAALTAATGLNRSTIGDLVAELQLSGLVQERPPEAGRVGRPSPVVAASADVVAIAVNPEVDAVEIAAIGLDRSVRARVRLDQETAPSPENVADLVGRWIAESDELRGSTIVGVGIAVPGLVRASDGLVRDAPHLGWRDVPLRDVVESRAGLPADLDNDATLGARAEHLFGAARGVDDAVYLNGGASGIGGGLVIGGQLVRGHSGYAGEFGQNRPGIVEPADRTTADGVLEDEVTRARLLALVGKAHADDAELADALGGIPDGEIERQRRILATALANAVNVLNPSVVVVGGFLAILVARDLPSFTAEVRSQAMSANAEDVEVRVAALGGDRLLVGAAERVFEERVLAG
ncbi:ROK family protein [Microbacter sp. GSS18]|nr:ROK family protein [Microbacter sp. GSS18]